MISDKQQVGELVWNTITRLFYKFTTYAKN